MHVYCGSQVDCSGEPMKSASIYLANNILLFFIVSYSETLFAFLYQGKYFLLYSQPYILKKGLSAGNECVATHTHTYTHSFISRMFVFPAMQRNNVTVAATYALFFYATLRWFKTELSSLQPPVLWIVKCGWKAILCKKVSLTHCRTITVHATRQLPDSVTARAIFRRMNKTFGHLSLRLLFKHRTRQRVFLLVRGEEPILSNLNYLLYILEAVWHPLLARFKDFWPRNFSFLIKELQMFSCSSN